MQQGKGGIHTYDHVMKMTYEDYLLLLMMKGRGMMIYTKYDNVGEVKVWQIMMVIIYTHYMYIYI